MENEKLKPSNRESNNQREIIDNLNPDFDISGVDLNISEKDILAEAIKHSLLPETVNHSEILPQLLEQIGPVDFREKAGIKDKDRDPSIKQIQIIVVECVLLTAIANKWQICKNNYTIYLYNGKYWMPFQAEPFESFLGKAAEKMRVDKFLAKYYVFKEQLFKQFMAASFLPKPDFIPNRVLINLLNGTFEIAPQKQVLRPPCSNDFLTYQLPFDYDPFAKAPQFDNYLQKVLPDLKVRQVLAEFMGYIFVDQSVLKMEKALLLYGGGANGKSVFFEIIYAVLGGEKNVSNYSLQSLTNDTGYYRAVIENKLLNYSSEISSKMGVAFFKQLVSGEPIEARLPYGNPYTITRYSKLVFNCNELPKEVEQTNAFYRRFLIIPFDVTIPEAEQDKELAKKIIDSELSGIFNWILDGLRRLLNQKKFTYSDIIENQLDQYKKQSDNVRFFLEEEGYEKSLNDYLPLKDLYSLYKSYCMECGYRACSLKTFSDRVKTIGYEMERKNVGMVVFILTPFAKDFGIPSRP